MSNNILIYGPPASGKTTIGKKLAKIFGIRFVDLDQEIESRTRDSIQQIIEILGENGFRKVEADIFQDLVLSNEKAIISLGGGTLLDNESRKIAETENTVICLDFDDAMLEKNFISDKKTRPLCNGNVEIYKKLVEQRKAHYQSFSNKIASAYLDSCINEENGLSTIFTGKLLEKGISAMINVLFPAAKVFVVYDKNVKRQALMICNELDNCIGNMKIVALECNKTMKTVDKIMHKLSKMNVGRGDLLLSIGGGITSDIVGFSASIWKRGIRWINVPTTLLSMVDASVGGKTAVNYNKVKNMIGAFHKPTIVFIDDRFIDTLDSKQFVQGCAEAYKHFLIDPGICQGNEQAVQMLKNLQNGDSTVDRCRTISKFLGVKLKLVKDDPFDKNGKREKLNLGHTIAHAIESITNNKVSHGEAVAIGIVEELHLAKKYGILKDEQLIDKITEDLQSLGLQTAVPAKCSFDEMTLAMKADKKNANGYIKFILLEKMHQLKELFLQV